MDQTSSPPTMRKISLMIIGAQKAGTTSLKNYLGQHPALQAHPHKEFSYFFNTEEHEKGYDTALKKYFTEESIGKRLLAKNAGLYVNEGGIRRLKEHNPGCRLVLILRNPIERTYSSYLMEKNYGTINSSFENLEPLIRTGGNDDWRYEFFVGMSLYHRHIAVLYHYFPKEQVKLVRYEDFDADPIAVCKGIFTWMGEDPSFTPDTGTRYNETHVNRSVTYGKFITRLLNNQNPLKKLIRKAMPGKTDYKVGEMLRNLNKSDRKYDPISPHMARLLRDFYESHNRQLSELTGMDFSEWNK